MLCSSSFISGWRATDSISLPKMMPIPIPAPIEPSPAPTPSAIALPASVTPVSVTCAIGTSRSMGTPFLVTLGGRAADVDRSEDGEDKCLKRGHQAKLEDEEGKGDREGEGADRRQSEQDGQATAHEQQQKVAGEDVGEKPH